ncbi:2-deoxystreptamine glucosyltransferase [Planctomycetes bacterium CA13]|uniref:2-deoxystreptamine glucosyltransferase n=1 Tax=Novipirellula herctigrandis TaxID=2527986 RepID=A0A5C5Z9Q2_9BACT|nr:2-deoxystreptamine glucosyltransferase [Planctomycetes bacterium CA13]
MRIAFVITELNPGGAERCLTEVAIGLAENGDDVRVYSIDARPSPDRSVLVDRLTQHGITVEFCDAISVWQAFKARQRLRHLLKSFAPDIVQTFLYHANVIGTFAAKEACEAVRVGGIRVAEAKPIRCQLERLAIKQMQHVVCVSEDVKAFAQKRLDASPSNTSVIPNGVDTVRFSTATPLNWSSLDWPSDCVVSLFVGRMHSQKGLELIQAQMDRLAPAGSNRRVLLVGDGPLSKSIDAWCNGFADRRVKRLPYQADVAPFMTASRVFLLPSRYEGMPNVIMEAMAAGRPVVSSNVEGTHELLAHSPELQLFPSGDGEAMSAAAEHFLSNRELSDEIGMQNQTRVRNDFSIPTMIDRYRALYRLLRA